MQHDLKEVNAYILGIVGLVLALFIPFGFIVLRVFQPLVAALLLTLFIPLIALIVGITGFVKSLRKKTLISKVAKILNTITIIISFILVAFSVYIFIKAGGFASI